MARRPRVGVDVDGVLADLLTPAFALMNDGFGLAVTPGHMTSWEFEGLIPEAVRGEYWRRLGAPGYVHDHLRPLPGAVEGVALLAERFEVYVVTSYLHDAETWVHERDAWVMEHFKIPRSRMVHTRAKYVFHGAALIDDKPQNVEEWRAEFPHGAGILWAQPYNAEYSAGYRTSDWREAIEWIEASVGRSAQR